MDKQWNSNSSVPTAQKIKIGQGTQLILFALIEFFIIFWRSVNSLDVFAALMNNEVKIQVGDKRR